MTHRTYSRLMLVGLWAVFWGCGSSSREPQTQTKSILRLPAISTPKPKSLGEINSFKTKIHSTVIKKVWSSLPDQMSAKNTFRSVMMKSLISIDGMPREQLSRALSDLLTSETECAGASCARILGVHAEEVPHFLDESADLVKSSHQVNQADRGKTRSILLSSLEEPQNLWRPEHASSEPIFADVDSARQVISGIISEQMPKLTKMIRELRYQINITRSDEELFMTKNCGPASTALQKILADRGIFAEARVNNLDTMDHEYLLYRALLEDQRTVEIIIDPTYQQFLFGYTNRHMFKNFTGGTIDDAAVLSKIKSYHLDKVLITTYANLDEALANLRKKLPEFDERSEIRFAYEKGPLDPARQRQHLEYLTQDQMTRLRKGREKP